jgi:O-antigen/teichoic acid export membrane protein
LAVFLAIEGAGVWALAIQTLAASILYVAIVWFFHPWRPQIALSPRLLDRPFRFAKFIFLSGLLDAFYGRIYALFIGKMFGVDDLGQYNRANATQGMPMGVLTGIVSRVAYPAFSALQGDKLRLSAAVRKAIIGIMAINIPAMLGMLAVADSLVLALFGDAWRPCIPILRILCLAGLIWPLYTINGQALIAQGHSRLFFRLEIIKKVLGIIVFIAAAPFGLEELAWSQVVIVVVWFAIHAYYTRTMLGYGGVSQVYDSLPWLLAGSCMAVAVWAMPYFLRLPLLGVLVLQLLLGTSLYMGFWIFWDASLLREASSLLPFRRVIESWRGGVSARI